MATCASDTDTGEGKGSCLICGDSKSIENSEEPQPSTVLSDSLQVYFILRHVLELPSEQLQGYLRSCPYPEKWVKICSDCGSSYVDKCKRIFEELVEVKRRFHEAKVEVVERIKQSEIQMEEKDKGQANRGDAAAKMPFVLDIWKETRTFIQQYDYGTPSVDPYFFQAGDLMATEKAVEMTLKRDGSNNPADKCPSDENIPTFEDDVIIKTEPLSPFNTERSKLTDLCDNYSKEGHHSDLDRSGDSEGSCSEYDPHEAEMSPSNSPDHSNDESDEFGDFEDQQEKKTSKSAIRQTILNRKKISSDSVEVGGPLRCRLCDKVLSSPRTLRHHMAAIHGKQKLKCPHCEKVFFHQKNLQGHLGNAHNLKTHKCTFSGCNKAFLKKSVLASHELYHKPPQFACQLCGKRFILGALLKRHLKQCKLRGEKPFKCDQCPAAYSRKDYLLNHLKKGHPKEGDGTRRRAFKNRVPFKCSECGVVSGHSKALQEHVDKMHEGKAEITRDLEQPRPQIKGKTGLKKEPRPDQDGKFTCDFEGCNRTFSGSRAFLIHSRAHGRQKSLKCDLCPRQFFLKVALENHKKSRHTPDALKSFKSECSFCGKVLSSKHALYTHLYYKHRQEKRDIDDTIFTCDLCPLTFVRESCLHLHKRLKHKDPFQCSECGKTVSSKDALRTHVRVVHEKKLQVICDVCGVTVSTPYYMKRHLKTAHNMGDFAVTRHPCTVEGCGRTFPSKRDLTSHVSYAHEGQCKFQCETCGKRVISAKNLRRHIQAMHTNREEKPWNCEVCGKSFAISQYLWLHKKTHLPKKEKVKVETQPQ